MDRMLLFADLHLCESNADLVLRIVLPELVQMARTYGCRHIACLGDFWKVRHALPVWLLNVVRDFWKGVTAEGFTVHLLSGNHDQVDVQGRNALESLEAPKVLVYSEPTVNDLGFWVPYRKDRAQQLEAIEHFSGSLWHPASTLLFGHFGVIGAQVAGLGEMTEGIPMAALAPFKRVILGHYHRPQGVGVIQPDGGCQIVYVGSPYHVDAGESNEFKRVLIPEEAGLASYPVVLGPRYWKFAAATMGEMQQAVELAGVKAGDIVQVEVPEGAHLGDIALVLKTAGVEHHTITHRVTALAPRLQVQASTAAGPTLEDYFMALLKLRAGDELALDPDRLVGEFRTLQLEATK
jgi:hypothetical protein